MAAATQAEADCSPSSRAMSVAGLAPSRAIARARKAAFARLAKDDIYQAMHRIRAIFCAARPRAQPPIHALATFMVRSIQAC